MMGDEIDYAAELHRMFVGCVLTKVERRGPYIRWYFVDDAGHERYQEWHSCLRVVPERQQQEV